MLTVLKINVFVLKGFYCAIFIVNSNNIEMFLKSTQVIKQQKSFIKKVEQKSFLRVGDD
jgi:hypothetical protein